MFQCMHDATFIGLLKKIADIGLGWAYYVVRTAHNNAINTQCLK